MPSFPNASTSAPRPAIAAPDGLHTYEVMVCPSCPVAVTLARGTRNRFAYCPRCGRGALHTVPERLPDPPAAWLVSVRESCQVCGYADRRMITAERDEPPPEPRGEVVRFPGAPDDQ